VNKPTHVPLKLLITFLILIFLVVIWVLDAGCPFYRVAGIPCPGCGMSRALISACRLDFRTAFAWHPMFWALPLLYLFFLFDFRPFRLSWLNLTVLLIIGTCFAAVYVIRLKNG